MCGIGVSLMLKSGVVAVNKYSFFVCGQCDYRHARVGIPDTVPYIQVCPGCGHVRHNAFIVMAVKSPYDWQDHVLPMQSISSIGGNYLMEINGGVFRVMPANMVTWTGMMANDAKVSWSSASDFAWRN